MMIKAKTSSTGLSDGIKYIEIPQGWKRILENDSICYISPSSCCLKSYENVIEYLKTDGTCKCGLDCPFFIHHVFNFDASVQNKEKKDVSQAIGNKASCKLCESNRLKGNSKSEYSVAASPLNQTLKHTAKKTIKPSTFDGTLTSKKVIGHSRTKLDSPKVKRSKKASSPLSDIPSPPPIPISSPVQNVPNNLGANQGPLPSFASIVSSSKFFNPGLNRGPLHPTGSLPLKTNEQNAFGFPKLISTTATSTSVSVVTTSSPTISAQVLEKNQNHLENLPMVNRIPAPSKLTSSPRVLVGGADNTAISSLSFTSVSTASSVSVPLTAVTTSTVVSVISTPTIPSLFSPLDGAAVSNKAVKLPLRAMPKSKPRARPKAKPKPKTDQKSGAKSKTTKGNAKGTPTMLTTVSSMQPSFPIPSLTVNAVVSSPTSSYWPMPASSVTGNINQTPFQTSTLDPLSSTIPYTPASLIGISTVNSSTNLTFAKPQVSQPVASQQSIASSSIQISQSYHSQGVRPQSSINSVTGGPSVQASQTSLTQASSSPVDGKGSTGGQVLAASINYPVVATPRIQAQAGMMYVAATPGVSVFPSNYPYMAASAQQMQTSHAQITQAQNAKSSLAVTTMVTTSQQPLNVSQVVSSEVGASQNQGKVSFQVPGMYVQGTTPNQMFPLNPQSFNMGQYKGAYQLPSAMYQAPVQGGAMAFIAPGATKGTYPGVPALATGNLGQFAYQNPYMFGIVMQPTTNQATSATATSTKSSQAASTCVTTSLQMIQNPAVAAAFESFVPIAPAAGGQGPRFAQTLAHLASAYNTFPSPGILQTPSHNQIQLAYQMMQMGSNPNAVHQQQMAGMSGLITPDKHPITQSVKQSLLTSMAAATVTTKGATQVTTKPQPVTQSVTSTITSVAQTTRENPTGMRSPLSTSSSPCSSAFSPHTTASALAQSTQSAYTLSTDAMSPNQRTLQSPLQNQIPSTATITSSPAGICNPPRTSYDTSSATGPSKTTATMQETLVLSHFEPSSCMASKSQTSITSTFSKANEKTTAVPAGKCLGAIHTSHSEQPIAGQKPVSYAPSYSSEQTQKLTVVSPSGEDAVAEKPSFEMNPQQHQLPKCDSNNISPLRTSNFPVSTEQHKMNLSIENTGPFNKPCTTGSVLSPTEVPTFTSTEREGASLLPDSKTANRTVGNDSVTVKQTKYESDANYYATNPLLGMKRSCEAIEVYPDPPESTDCDDDERDDYCSSNEDPMERDPMHDDGSTETVRDLRQHGDNQHIEDKFLVTNQVRNPTKDMYNGGCNEVLKEQEMKNEHLGVNLKANQAFPPFRPEMLGELSIPHVRPHFDIGDVVWAQARGLPSWPGQIVDESKVGKGRPDEGKKWVMWFGDHTFSQVEVDRLKTLNEGLRTLDDKTRKKKYRAKKARISMEQAINEALEELEVRERLKAKQQGMRAKTKKKCLR